MLSEVFIQCPYCGETITVFPDPSLDGQNYIEDCTVCCRPIELHLSVDGDGDALVTARRDDD
ncbi:MAG: CPXCG motif-containing cysteine-rich protein [Gammaproteobacteria bacterium]|nr:CPXCG motif-containing cysteine-rich protein [Gammaproteobacteria bacterium]